LNKIGNKNKFFNHEKQSLFRASNFTFIPSEVYEPLVFRLKL